VPKIHSALLLLIACVPLALASTPSDEANLQIGAQASKALAQVQGFAQRQKNDPSVQAESCLALIALGQLSPSPEITSAARTLADRLVDMRDLNQDGKVGWGIAATAAPGPGCKQPGEFDAFADGTCNAANREYMFETGLVSMCLARMSIVTKDMRYALVAARALDDSWDMGTVPAACPSCFYYWYSYDQNDINRYVQNSNVLMGAAAAWVAEATGQIKYRIRARAVARSEEREVDAGNFNYFGIDDATHQRQSVNKTRALENHLAWVGKSLLDMGRLLDDAETLRDGIMVQSAWQRCGVDSSCARNCSVNASDADKCRESATASPCFFKNIDSFLAEQCVLAIGRLAPLGMTPAMWWALLDQ